MKSLGRYGETSALYGRHMDPRFLLEPDAYFGPGLEDRDQVGGIQATVRSSRFRVGPLAQNHERPITLFHESLLAALGS